jgi:hypothetical protein
MIRAVLRSYVIVMAAALTASAGPASAQLARVPASRLGPPAERFVMHPYESALSAVANYQSCGALARSRAAREVTIALREIEAAALAKGLGPTLERLRRDYHATMAVATTTACAGGPVRALAEARSALRAFRAWVAAQPAR